jgi:hypothetical protein
MAQGSGRDGIDLETRILAHKTLRGWHTKGQYPGVIKQRWLDGLLSSRLYWQGSCHPLVVLEIVLAD